MIKEKKKEEVEELRKLLKGHEARLSKLEELIVRGKSKRDEGNKRGKKLALKEFILERDPKKDVLKTLTIGYYLEKYKGISSFTVEDIIRGFRLAKEPVPDKINDKVYQNAKKGHMMEVEEKKDGHKAWQLTSSGERFVENEFKEN